MVTRQCLLFDGKPEARQNAARSERLCQRTFEQLVNNALPNADSGCS
jgi:hypothetical protein